MSPRRSIAALRDVEDPAWPGLLEQIERSDLDVRILPVDRARGEATLECLQVTARSTLGALALHCGGLVVDHGWLRILGGGGAGLADLATASGLTPASAGPPPAVAVGYDVLGGRFAIDGGGLGCATGEVCYFGPDDLQWTAIGGGHTAFVSWALEGGPAEFYADLRWPGWEAESSALALDEGISIYPFPFTAEGRDLAAASRRAVPFAELLGIQEEMLRQL